MMMGKTIIKERKAPSRNLPVCYLPSLSTANLQTFLRGGSGGGRTELRARTSSRGPRPPRPGEPPASRLPPPTLHQTKGPRPRDSPGPRLGRGVLGHPLGARSGEPFSHPCAGPPRGPRGRAALWMTWGVASFTVWPNLRVSQERRGGRVPRGPGSREGAMAAAGCVRGQGGKGVAGVRRVGRVCEVA